MSTKAISEMPINDKNLGKQMGSCMSGFFNIFDRAHILSGKRLYPKRLSPPPASDSASEAVSSGGSPALSREFEKPKTEQQQPELRSMAPENSYTPVTPPPKSPSSATPWKFSREAPRLSLDSRAVTDGKGGLRPREIRINKVSSSGGAADDYEEERESQQRRSPSVIARLMGLEPLPSSVGISDSGEPEPEKISELRRSASESRWRDYRFVDGPSFLFPSKYESVGERKLDRSIVNKQQNGSDNNKNNNSKTRNRNEYNNNHNNNNSQRRLMVERRSYYDTTDFFPPEIPTKQHQPVTIYGEIERTLKTKGIDEMSKDPETLKHILEAMQLKGLLHSSSTSAYDRGFFTGKESPIVLMKPARPTSPTQTRRRTDNVSSVEPALSPRKERSARSVTRSSGRGDNSSSGPTLRCKGGPLGLETQRRGNESTTSRNSHLPDSPRLIKRSNNQTVNRSPRSRKPTVETYQRCGPTFAEDEVSTASASSFSNSSCTDNERWRVEEYNDGKNLLERCGKLLHNIAEITAKSSSNSNSVELQQPSPVSVLDSSFYKEDESSPSPVKKRTIDFKDDGVIELEEELWTPISSPTEFLSLSENSEFNYVSEVIRASNYLPDDENLFFLLEKQSSIRGVGRDVSKVSVLERKLTFDTITEILDRNRQLLPWTMGSNLGKRSTLEQIWSEYNNIREEDPSGDLLEVICGVLKKDLTRDSITGWSDFPAEMSEAALNIERLIFKDIIGETILDLGAVARKSRGVQSLCRKLVF